MEDPPLASLGLTHVHYNPEDPLSHLSAYLALVPQALCITYATLAWSTREFEVIAMFAGQMACEGLNWILKRYIKQPRPTKMHGKGYGMPSSHAQFVSFFAVALTLFALFRHAPHAQHPFSSTHVPTPFWQRALLSLFVFAGAAAVAQSRIYLSYHTPNQVYVGCVAGAACAVAWFVAVSAARYFGFVDWILDLEIAKWLRIRDLVVEEDLVDAGWERWERRRQAKKSKKANGEFQSQKKRK